MAEPASDGEATSLGFPAEQLKFWKGNHAGHNFDCEGCHMLARVEQEVTRRANLAEWFRWWLKYTEGDCPENCNGGTIPVHVGDGEWEPNECEWCALVTVANEHLAALLDTEVGDG